MRVLVLGGTGMLGSMVAKVLPDEWEVLVTYRTGAPFSYEPVNGRWVPLNVGAESWIQTIDSYAQDCDWIINCIGATKPLLPDESVESTTLAANVNVILPSVLSAMKEGPNTIQIATDCVFSGTAGPYDETCPADARDLYGFTKALGEAPSILHLRCSIVGPEVRYPARYLLGKVVNGEVTKGYTNHLWNGVTTLAFAKICVGIMNNSHIADLASVQAHHLIPADSLSKAELIDIIVSEFKVGQAIAWVDDPDVDKLDRRLLTVAPDMNEELWKAAGYEDAPTIDRLIEELADFCRRETWPQPGVEGWRYWRQ